MKLLAASAIVLSSVAVFVACGGNKEAENPQPVYQQQPGQTDQTYQQQQTTTPATDTTTTTQPQGPAANDPALQQVMSVQIASIAQTQASGMTKQGETMGATLQEGQTLEQAVTLQPGKCYTVVALGMPNIQDLRVVLEPVVPAGIPNVMTLSQSMTSGSQLTMAPTPNCYTLLSPLAVQAKIIVTARAGSGPVGAQLYMK